MGWKSTRTITRERAIELIESRLLTCSDNELSNAVESLGFGENMDLPYYGQNFMIGSEKEQDLDDNKYIY